MRAVILTLCFSLSIPVSYASTCMQERQDSIALKEHLMVHSEIKVVQAMNDGDERLVIIKTPQRYDDYSFSSLLISKKVSEAENGHVYWIPLAHRKEGNSYYADFNMSRELLVGAALQFTYKKYKNCGISAELELVTND